MLCYSKLNEEDQKWKYSTFKLDFNKMIQISEKYNSQSTKGVLK